MTVGCCERWLNGLFAARVAYRCTEWSPAKTILTPSLVSELRSRSRRVSVNLGESDSKNPSASSSMMSIHAAVVGL